MCRRKTIGKQAAPLALAHSWQVRPRFSCTHSLLGLLIRRLVKDVRLAEAVVLVVLPSLILVIILLQFLAWTWLAPVIEADVSGPVAARFFEAQIWGAAVFLLTCIAGWVPGVRVQLRGECLEVRQGRRARSLHLSLIVHSVTVTMLQWHREYRPYEEVEAYVSRLTSRVLMLDTNEVQIAIGLHRSDCDELAKLLSEHMAARERTAAAANAAR